MRRRILLVHNRPRTFVLLDRDLLRDRYDVTELHIRRWTNPFTVFRAVAGHDLVFGWFASWHTLLPLLFARLLGKPSMLVVGGYDVANLPEIRYGLSTSPYLRWISRVTVRLANRCAAFSQASWNEAVENAHANRERTELVYLGVPDPFKRPMSASRESMALSVGDVSESNLSRKGHEPFIRAAALLPDVRFVLVGPWLDGAVERLRSIATPNVSIVGRIRDDELHDLYSRASVYVQASAHEGFGLSVAEAMLGGCIPVVSAVGALPEVVGDAGIYTTREAKDIAAAVSAALTTPGPLRQAARERILSTFPPKARADHLHAIIDRLCSMHSR